MQSNESSSLIFANKRIPQEVKDKNEKTIKQKCVRNNRET